MVEVSQDTTDKLWDEYLEKDFTGEATKGIPPDLMEIIKNLCKKCFAVGVHLGVTLK